MHRSSLRREGGARLGGRVKQEVEEDNESVMVIPCGERGRRRRNVKVEVKDEVHSIEEGFHRRVNIKYEKREQEFHPKSPESYIDNNESVRPRIMDEEEYRRHTHILDGIVRRPKMHFVRRTEQGTKDVKEELTPEANLSPKRELIPPEDSSSDRRPPPTRRRSPIQVQNGVKLASAMANIANNIPKHVFIEPQLMMWTMETEERLIATFMRKGPSIDHELYRGDLREYFTKQVNRLFDNYFRERIVYKKPNNLKNFKKIEDPDAAYREEAKAAARPTPLYIPPLIRCLLSQDLTRGIVDVSVPVYADDPDGPPFPHAFKYISENEPFDTQERMSKIALGKVVRDIKTACNCHDGCRIGCPCRYGGLVNSTTKSNLIREDGTVVPRNYYDYTIFECGDDCTCTRKECLNRIKTIKQAFEVYKPHDSPMKGFCLRTLTDIRFGDPVMEFTGEVVSHSELSERGPDSVDYAFLLCDQDDFLHTKLISLPAKDKKSAERYKFYVDPFRKGNFARFLAHSCMPNLELVKVKMNTIMPWNAKLLFVANQTIPAGSELAFDYGQAYNGFPRKECLCAAELCTSNKELIRRLSDRWTVHTLVSYIEEKDRATVAFMKRREEHLLAAYPNDGSDDDDEYY